MAREPHRTFGGLLRRYRLAAGLTHEGLAERATLSARAISDLERGISRGPRPATLALLIEALRLPPEQRAALEAAARPPVDPRVVRPDSGPRVANLPVQLTSFVGREREVCEVQDLLRREDVRLVTLAGPGGTGKTRLAIRVAEEILPAFEHGVCFVSLAPIADRDGVVPALARALGLTEAGVVTPSHLLDALRDRHLLLLLDNFEHLLGAAPLVVELLQGCPRLKALVTSRAVLRLSGEQEFPVSPFPLPDLNELPSADVLTRFAAIALFVERAARVRPAFTLTAENAGPIAAICARLDGLPLAIELAAARIRMFSPPALLKRLAGEAAGATLQVLTGGTRDAPPRQRTLRDTMAWSYNLLDPHEQRLMRRLAVFAGGCTLGSAEAVAGPTVDTSGAEDGLVAQPRRSIMDLLASLVDASLLTQEEGPDRRSRFRMLETVREYALERLEESDEAGALRRRHAEHYLSLVKATGALLFATEEQQLRMAAEQDNVQAALRWLVQHG